MDILRLVIIEKCEVKDISNWSNYDYMATRLDILGNYSANGQHKSFVFQATYFKISLNTSR